MNSYSHPCEILPEDVSEEYRDIVETIGMNAFVQLTLLCGGQNLYIPKRESILRGSRDREIRARFNGGNYRALATQFRLSERQIRKILNPPPSIKREEWEKLT